MLTNQGMVDLAEVQTLVTEVLQHPHPAGRLNQIFINIDKTVDPHFAVAVFESVFSRIWISDYWVFTGMAQAYERIGRADAAFFCAALAAQTNPAGPAGVLINAILFRYFKNLHRPHDAVEIFKLSLKNFPGPIAPPDQIESLLAATGLSVTADLHGDTDGRKNHRVVESSLRPAWTCPAVFGARLPKSLDELRTAQPRRAIDVAEFSDGELWVFDDEILVVNRTGVVQPDVSAVSSPDRLAKTFLNQRADDIPLEQIELAEAVVIKDFMAGHNYGHFLIDQTPRLALFEQLGVDVRGTPVIGPEVTTRFQQEILGALGVTRYIGSRRRARIKVKRLWVSTDGNHFLPIAHGGESWGINFTRARLGLPPFEAMPRVSTGTRRLYVSRNDGEGRHIANEAELLPLLRDYGFERVTAEKLSFMQQIDLFRNASHVIGPHGAGLANLIFAPRGLTFMEFFHPLFAPNNFAMLVPALGMNYSAFVGLDALTDALEMNDLSHAPPWDPTTPYPWRFRDMRVDKELLRSWLERFAA